MSFSILQKNNQDEDKTMNNMEHLNLLLSKLLDVLCNNSVFIHIIMLSHIHSHILIISLTATPLTNTIEVFIYYYYTGRKYQVRYV